MHLYVTAVKTKSVLLMRAEIDVDGVPLKKKRMAQSYYFVMKRYCLALL